jgi:RNA polymerase sigma-70 factor (ECF subfamily)
MGNHDSHGARRPPDGGAQPSRRTSVELLRRARLGDSEALDRLCERYLPSLRRWASGRLPRWARSLANTEDLVQDTIVRVLPHVDRFEPRREGGLQAYMRQALLNRIREEIRRSSRRPRGVEAHFEGIDPAASPLEEAIGQEALERYETALKRLRPEDREAIIARVEMACTYEELAEALDKPSADAARMAVRRALLRLAREMDHEP